MNVSVSPHKLSELGILPLGGDDFTPMPASEIERLEEALEHRLPEDYRAFLCRYGTSSFEHETCIEPVIPLPPEVGGDAGTGAFSHFYGAKSDQYVYSLSLEWNLNMFRDRMPASIIPIGDDGGGHQICLGISGEERGKVYLWDHHNEWDEADYTDIGEPIPNRLEFQNVHLIAESFRDFIDNRLCIDDQ